MTLQASQLISRTLRISRQAQHTKRHLHLTQRIVLEYLDSRDAFLSTEQRWLSEGENLVGRRNIPPLGAAMDETDLFEGDQQIRRESATDLGVAAPSSNRRATDGAEFARSQSDSWRRDQNPMAMRTVMARWLRAASITSPALAPTAPPIAAKRNVSASVVLQGCGNRSHVSILAAPPRVSMSGSRRSPGKMFEFQLVFR